MLPPYNILCITQITKRGNVSLTLWVQNKVSDTLFLFVICGKHAVHESGYQA